MKSLVSSRLAAGLTLVLYSSSLGACAPETPVDSSAEARHEANDEQMTDHPSGEEKKLPVYCQSAVDRRLSSGVYNQLFKNSDHASRVLSSMGGECLDTLRALDGLVGKLKNREKRRERVRNDIAAIINAYESGNRRQYKVEWGTTDPQEARRRGLAVVASTYVIAGLGVLVGLYLRNTYKMLTLREPDACELPQGIPDPASIPDVRNSYTNNYFLLRCSVAVDAVLSNTGTRYLASRHSACQNHDDLFYVTNPIMTTVAATLEGTRHVWSRFGTGFVDRMNVLVNTIRGQSVRRSALYNIGAVGEMVYTRIDTEVLQLTLMGIIFTVLQSCLAGGNVDIARDFIVTLYNVVGQLAVLGGSASGLPDQMRK